MYEVYVVSVTTEAAGSADIADGPAEAAKADTNAYPADLAAFSPLVGTKYLKKAPAAADWTYTAASGTVVAKAGGKYDTVLAACNA